MKSKTSELTGAALDWAVALIEFPAPHYEDDDRLVYVHGDDEFQFAPSTDWAQGGPIIERELIDVVRVGISNRCASRSIEDGSIVRGYGLTPLIAAMRCYVASKLGDEIEVPDGPM